MVDEPEETDDIDASATHSRANAQKVNPDCKHPMGMCNCTPPNPLRCNWCRVINGRVVARCLRGSNHIGPHKWPKE